jgi:hypothetical protein
MSRSAVQPIGLPVVALVVTLGSFTSPRAALPEQAGTPDAERAARMQEHFAQVSVIHAAIVHGDLAAVREPAMSLAEQGEPKGLPPGTAPHVATMTRAAKSAAEARDISAAATATASMFAACGDCHRASGTMPAAALPVRPEVGGGVGHMLDHQRASTRCCGD